MEINSFQTFNPLITPRLSNARNRTLKKSLLKRNNGTRRLNILKIGQFNGPVCDTIGFSQHTGECWHDTMIQMLFFADGLKDITQKFFYNLKDNDIYDYIRNKGVTNDSYMNAIVKYIISIRNRFINHYNYIRDPEVGAICNIKKGRNLYNYIQRETKPSLAKMKREESMKLGIISANMALKLTGTKNNKWKKNLENILSNSYKMETIKATGASIDTSMKVLHMILSLFKFPYLIAKFNELDFDPFKYDKEYKLVSGIYLSGNLYSYLNKNPSYYYYNIYDNIYQYHGRHAVGFIKCDNVWSYFDDNHGLMNANVGGRLLHIIKRDYINNKKHIEFITCQYLDENDDSIIEINCHLIQSSLGNNGERTIDAIYYKMEWIEFDDFVNALNEKAMHPRILHIFIVNNQHKEYNINDNTISFLIPPELQ